MYNFSKSLIIFSLSLLPDKLKVHSAGGVKLLLFASISFDAVNKLVSEAPFCVQRLQKLGMEFDSDSNGLCTTLEAAHSFRRVLHVQDQTGRALVDFLRDQRCPLSPTPRALWRKGAGC